jgi:hypothetical protein
MYMCRHCYVYLHVYPYDGDIHTLSTLYINNLIINDSIFDSSHPSQSPRSPASSSFASPSPTCDPTCPRTPRACKPEEMRRASSPSIQSIHPASQTKKCHKSSQAVHPAVHPASPSQHPGLPCEGFPPSLLFTGRVTEWIRLWPWPSDGTYDGTYCPKYLHRYLQHLLH